MRDRKSPLYIRAICGLFFYPRKDGQKMNRNANLNELKNKKFDLLVLGGGITGAGIALDAQSRGLDTGLIDMQDFAAGTSSRSTKLVHGGLRYLKQMQIGVVAEVGKERAIVYENAPHVTNPEWMLLPLIKGGTFGLFTTGIGLRVYDFLAGVKKSERRKMLSKEEAMKKEPLLVKDTLKGAGYYVEYKTDDARLTLEVAKKADELGATLANYVKADDFIYENGKVIGVKAVDVLSGEAFPIYAKEVVNATGIWVDGLRKKDGSLSGKKLFHTKGVHLVFDQQDFPLQNAVYFDTPDKRMVFAIPRNGKTYLGTTDTKYEGDLVNPEMTEEDRDYLLKTVELVFPTLSLSKDQIESHWAGVRPLIYEEGKKESEISRKDEIFYSDTGLITIAGGKLTGYRKMAEKTVDVVAERLGNNQSCQTDHIILSGGEVGGSNGYQSFVEEQIKNGKAIGFTEQEAKRIVERYGSNVKQVFEIAKKAKGEHDKVNLSLEAYATLIYSLEEEMTETPTDYFMRRTSAILFNKQWALKYSEAVVTFMSDYFAWDEQMTEKMRAELQEEMNKA